MTGEGDASERLGGGAPGSSGRHRIFGLRHVAFRRAWRLAWLLLARWTPPPLHRWRRLVLVAFGARLHPTARVYPSVVIFDPRRLVMGAHSVIGRGTRIYNVAEVSLGDHADIAWNVHILSATHDLNDLRFEVVARPIRIEPFAWVAVGAMVGAGVTVGEGAVLGARGVAFSDLQPWTIYAGNPARILRRRPDAVVEEARRIRGQDALNGGPVTAGGR